MSRTEQKRIVLWTTPRTLSTAFCRAMMSRKACKTFVEPSIKQYYMSENAVINRIPPGGKPAPKSSWKDLYELLNEPYEGYQEVFAKEMPYRFKAWLDKLHEVIPEDYISVFLVRNPHRTVPSLYNLHPETTAELSWKEQEELFCKLTEEKGYEPFVIDADDLQRDPETVLKHFCKAVGIDYQDTMINWTPIPDDCVDQLQRYEVAFERARESNKFLPSTPKAVVQDDKLSDAAKKAIDEAMPYYMKFKERSFKLGQ